MAADHLRSKACLSADSSEVELLKSISSKTLKRLSTRSLSSCLVRLVRITSSELTRSQGSKIVTRFLGYFLVPCLLTFAASMLGRLRDSSRLIRLSMRSLNSCLHAHDVSPHQRDYQYLDYKPWGVRRRRTDRDDNQHLWSCDQHPRPLTYAPAVLQDDGSLYHQDHHRRPIPCC